MSGARPAPVDAVVGPDLGRRNLRAVSLTSFLTDVSSEMVMHLLPLYLAGTLGVRVSVVGLVEGVATSLASLVKVFSGRLSDRLGSRKGLAVVGYGLSAAAKPFFLVAQSWGAVAAVRWTERLGKGVRTAPRDALLADSVAVGRRGLAFGLHRAADTAGAVVGLGVAWWLVSRAQGGAVVLDAGVFRQVVLWSLAPALVGVMVLALLARDPPAVRRAVAARPRLGVRGLGRPFATFLAIVALFELGNSSEAFIVLRASERGMSVATVLAVLLLMNVTYAAVSSPAGALSDRWGRRRILVAGWLVYAAVYLGLARAEEASDLWLLAAVYGVYNGLTVGTARALVADLVPAELRGTAFGTLAAVTGLLDLPAAVIAGVLWHGVGAWHGFGPPAPFLLGAATALLAAAALAGWSPSGAPTSRRSL